MGSGVGETGAAGRKDAEDEEDAAGRAASTAPLPSRVERRGLEENKTEDEVNSPHSGGTDKEPTGAVSEETEVSGPEPGAAREKERTEEENGKAEKDDAERADKDNRGAADGRDAKGSLSDNAGAATAEGNTGASDRTEPRQTGALETTLIAPTTGTDDKGREGWGSEE